MDRPGIGRRKEGKGRQKSWESTDWEERRKFRKRESGKREGKGKVKGNEEREGKDE